MADKPAILIVQPHLGPVDGLLAGAFECHRAWEEPTAEALARIEALVVAGEYPLDKPLIERLPALKHIAVFTSGYDGVDVPWARARGLVVTHAANVNAEDVADHALGLILASRRRIVDGDRIVKSGGWKPEDRLLTPSMTGRRVGLVGLGAIGAGLARRLEPMGCVIAWWGPRDKPTAPWPKAPDLLSLARDSEVLVVCAKASEETRGLIDGAVIEAVGPQGLLVNVSRGQLVDEDALIAALKTGRLGQAALDVFAEEPTPGERWADVPNVVLTPHTAGATQEAVQRMFGLLLQNLTAVLAGEPPVTPVPEI
ncbi:MAG: hydroxyacid dehydrogenase [Caulobacterales bacterium 68-7]|nr:2-hydroxyacid dehydrogenase [Caulobacterales bacterium]OJU08565.1 MAG: hydroxyacid dehydrogenase [Caulobacterales bacterium 68-7]